MQMYKVMMLPMAEEDIMNNTDYIAFEKKAPETALELAMGFRNTIAKLEYGFSLFKMSTQRVGILNYNPPASRVVTHCYTQKSPFRTIIEVSSHYLRKER